MKNPEERLQRHLDFLVQDPTNIHLLLTLAAHYRQRQDFKQAQIYLTRAYAIDANASALEQGLWHAAQNDYHAAIPLLSAALAITPNAQGCFELARSHYSVGDVQAALMTLTAQPTHQLSLEAQLLLAKILHEMDALEQAQLILKHIISTQPEEAHALGMLALVLWDSGEDRKAQGYAQKALAINPTQYEASLVHAFSHLYGGQMQPDTVQALTERRPDDARAWYVLGCAQFNLLDLDNAITSLTRACVIYPEYIDAWLVLGWAQLMNNRYGAAEHSFNQSLILSPKDIEGLSGLTIACVQQNKKTQALFCVHQIEPNRPLSAQSHLALAIYYKECDPVRAQTHLATAVKHPTALMITRFLENNKGKAPVLH